MILPVPASPWGAGTRWIASRSSSPSPKSEESTSASSPSCRPSSATAGGASPSAPAAPPSPPSVRRALLRRPFRHSSPDCRASSTSGRSRSASKRPTRFATARASRAMVASSRASPSPGCRSGPKSQSVLRWRERRRRVSIEEIFSLGSGQIHCVVEWKHEAREWTITGGASYQGSRLNFHRHAVYSCHVQRRVCRHPLRRQHHQLPVVREDLGDELAFLVC